MIRWRRHKKKLGFVILAVALFYAVIHFSPKEHVVQHGDKKLSSPPFVNTPQSAEGFLNVAIWEEICGHEMQTLKEFPVFPHGPSTRLLTSSLRLKFTPEFENFGLRIFGFLSPYESGNYDFYIASSGTSELWISSDSKPQNSKLILNTTAGVYSWKYSNKRNSIPLLAGKRYYLEILVKHGSHGKGKLNHLHVTWKLPREHEPKEIPLDVFIAYDRTFDRDTGVVLPIHVKHRDPSFVNEEVQRRAEMHYLPFISEGDSQNLFPPCVYNPSYLVKGPLKRYQGTWEMHYTSIYPFDHADVVEPKGEAGDFLTFSNDQLNESTAKTIVSQVWTQIQRKFPG